MSDRTAIADALRSVLMSDSNGEPVNVVDGLFAVAKAIVYAADQIGKGDATTGRGAIEELGQCVHDGLRGLTEAIQIGAMFPTSGVNSH